MDRNQEQQQNQQPAQGHHEEQPEQRPTPQPAQEEAPYNPYSRNRRFNKTKKFNKQLKYDAKGEQLTFSSSEDEEYEPAPTTRGVVALVRDHHKEAVTPVELVELIFAPQENVAEVVRTAPQPQYRQYNEEYYGADGSLPGPSNAPQQYLEGYEWEDESAPLPSHAPGQYEAEEGVSSLGDLVLADEVINDLDLEPNAIEDLEDLFENNPNNMSFVDILFQGVLEAEGEVAPEEVEGEEVLEMMDEEEQEEREGAEAARRMERLKKLAEEEEKSMQLIREIQKQDQMENRVRTLRSRGRLENPKRKPSADKEKVQEKLREKAKGLDLFKFKPGTSNDVNNPEIDRILQSLGKTRVETRPEERRRKRIEPEPESESEVEDENYDPQESRRARRKQQAKKRRTNDGKRH